MNKSFFILVLLTVYLLPIQSQKESVAPVKISIPLYQNCEMVVGDSRVLKVMFFSSNNNLNSDGYKTVTEKKVTWSIDPPQVVSIDNYGRLEALKKGVAKITARSNANPNVFATVTITVLDKPIFHRDKKPIVHFKGKPALPLGNLQKLVVRYEKSEIDMDVPGNIRELINNAPDFPGIYQQVTQGNVVWKIVPFADGSDGKYVMRTDHSLSNANRDKIQHFMGDRYLPDDGKSPSWILDDGQNGIWVVNKSTTKSPYITTHIKMVRMDYSSKAAYMVKETAKKVMRMGMASGAYFDHNKKWHSFISDNDGLWTSMYGSGELMRYAITKTPEARKSALKSLKAVLFIANIAGRDKTIDARLRHLNNLVVGAGNLYSNKYLKKEATFALESYCGSPATRMGYYGLNAGKAIKGRYIGGKYKFSLGPVNPNDWTTDGPAATTKRTLNGFIARTFSIPAIEKTPFHDNLFIMRNCDKDGNPSETGHYQKVLSGAHLLYDYSENEKPVLPLRNLPIPEILKDVLTVNGKRYTAKDVCYKGDTSTDEIIGHLFIYKIAHDILDETNEEEKTLKKLVKNVVVNLAKHYVNNGYGLVDATGQGTTWGKTTRNYFNSDYTMGDNPLNSIVLLCAFKLAHYITGDKRWHNEYMLLAENKAFRYADLATLYWKEWMWMVQNDDIYPEKNIYKLEAGALPVEKTRHALYVLNYSDQEMAMLAYYLLFQMETNEKLLNKYKKAMESWWHGMSQGENPLWYYIYQLAYPEQRKKDVYGNDLVETASWTLNRHPIDTRAYQAHIEGSRADVLRDHMLAIDPTKIIGKRTSKTDQQNADIPINKKLDPNYDAKNIYQVKILPQDERALYKYNNTTFRKISKRASRVMYAATTYTLPYWLGRYHKMLQEDSK